MSEHMCECPTCDGTGRISTDGNPDLPYFRCLDCTKGMVPGYRSSKRKYRDIIFDEADARAQHEEASVPSECFIEDCIWCKQAEEDGTPDGRTQAERE